MDEYISRKAAIDVIMSEPTDAHYPSWYSDKIESISIADVAPVRHGRWIMLPYTEQYKNKCSNWGKGSDLETDYCPNCGAKMDGESDE